MERRDPVLLDDQGEQRSAVMAAISIIETRFSAIPYGRRNPLIQS